MTADDTDWAALTAAYFGDPDMRALFEALASDDENDAVGAWEELSPSVMESGDVFESTAAAVPLLLRLAATAHHQRAGLLTTVAMRADPEVAHGEHRPLVHAALRAHADLVTALIDDPDPEVRRAAAYALAVSG